MLWCVIATAIKIIKYSFNITEIWNILQINQKSDRTNVSHCGIFLTKTNPKRLLVLNDTIHISRKKEKLKHKKGLSSSLPSFHHKMFNKSK